jgi:hypothetical protein
MPMHDWTRVNAGIYHDFHHEWISEIKRALNRHLLPAEYYALAEQQAAGFGPDVLTLQSKELTTPPEPAGGAIAVARPRATHIAETSADFLRRRKSTVVVRHVSGDRVVSIVEIISPGNKSGTSAFQALVNKACELLEHGVHLLIIDPFPPGRRDPLGIHAAIWSSVDDDPYSPPPERPLTFVSYQCGPTTRAYVEPLAVGECLPNMPLFLAPESHVKVPLELTYEAAWETVPKRWQSVVADG